MIDDALMQALISGERPPNVPDHWVGTPTRSATGFRWDDPNNPNNSVRIFQGDPNDTNPSHRAPFVIVIRDGDVLDQTGNVITDEAVTAEALQHT